MTELSNDEKEEVYEHFYNLFYNLETILQLWKLDEKEKEAAE